MRSLESSSRDAGDLEKSGGLRLTAERPIPPVPLPPRSPSESGELPSSSLLLLSPSPVPVSSCDGWIKLIDSGLARLLWIDQSWLLGMGVCRVRLVLGQETETG